MPRLKSCPQKNHTQTHTQTHTRTKYAVLGIMFLDDVCADALETHTLGHREDVSCLSVDVFLCLSHTHSPSLSLYPTSLPFSKERKDGVCLCVCEFQCERANVSVSFSLCTCSFISAARIPSMSCRRNALRFDSRDVRVCLWVAGASTPAFTRKLRRFHGASRKAPVDVIHEINNSSMFVECFIFNGYPNTSYIIQACNCFPPTRRS
jgi:hypothetical protein